MNKPFIELNTPTKAESKKCFLKQERQQTKGTPFGTLLFLFKRVQAAGLPSARLSCAVGV